MKVKMGIIGAGSIANSFAEAIPLTDNAELVAVASRTLKKAEDFCQKHNLTKAYGSYEEILCDSEIDAIYIATVHSSHFEIAKACINAGKAVLCEKPFVLTANEVNELSKLASEKNVLLMEAMWTRFLPTMQKAKEWINSGKIGEVQSISANFGFSCPPNEENRLYNKAVAGGAMYDVGVYVIEFAQDFANSKIETAYSLGKFGKTGVDETSVIALQFENGILADLKASIRASMHNDAYIYASQGHIFFDNFHAGSRVCLYDNNFNLIEEFDSKLYKKPENFNLQIKHFADLFLNKKIQSDMITLNDNYQCAEVFETLFSVE